MTVNRSFIRKHEGFSLAGYVPQRDGVAIDHSGVTIATGVDIGAMTAEIPATLGLSRAVIEKLAPYIGLRGAAAIGALQHRPLSLYMDEADELDAAVERMSLARLVASFNLEAGSRGLGGWSTLTDAQQTVIASVAWQYGSLWNDTPKFWRAATSHDWLTAIDELRNFGDAYSRRRKDEANYLSASLGLPLIA